MSNDLAEDGISTSSILSKEEEESFAGSASASVSAAGSLTSRGPSRVGKRLRKKNRGGLTEAETARLMAADELSWPGHKTRPLHQPGLTPAERADARVRKALLAARAHPVKAVHDHSMQELWARTRHRLGVAAKLRDLAALPDESKLGPSPSHLMLASSRYLTARDHDE